MTKIVDYDPCKDASLWFVVFTRTATHLMPWWIDLFTRGGFRHCYAFRDYRGITLIVNQVAQGLLLDATKVRAAECAKALARQADVTVVLFASQLKPRYTPRGVQTCVSVVKSLLGLKLWRIWTPQELHDYLIQNGGVVLCQAEKVVKSSPAKKNAAPSTRASRPNSPTESSSTPTKNGG